MLRPVIGGASRAFHLFGMSRFDKEEVEALELSGGAVLYQEGGNFNAWLLLWAAIGGVVGPRLLEKMNQLEADKEARKIAREARAVERNMGPITRVTPPKETPL